MGSIGRHNPADRCPDCAPLPVVVSDSTHPGDDTVINGVPLSLAAQLGIDAVPLSDSTALIEELREVAREVRGPSGERRGGLAERIFVVADRLAALHPTSEGDQ